MLTRIMKENGTNRIGQTAMKTTAGDPESWVEMTDRVTDPEGSNHA
jgi:hypothetical protein